MMAHAIKYEEFTNKHESCYHCSGYYGPCFGEPLCATCHAFLCPHDPFMREMPLQLCDLKADECDSGNEEPRDSQQDCVQPRVVQLLNQHILYRYPTANGSSSSPDAPTFNDDSDPGDDNNLPAQAYSNDYHHNRPSNGNAQEALDHEEAASVIDVTATYSKYLLSLQNKPAGEEESMASFLAHLHRSPKAVPVQNGVAASGSAAPAVAAAAVAATAAAAAAESLGGIESARSAVCVEAFNTNDGIAPHCVQHLIKHRRTNWPANQGGSTSDSDSDGKEVCLLQQPLRSSGIAEASGFARSVQSREARDDEDDDHHSQYREGSNNNINHRAEGVIRDRGRRPYNQGHHRSNNRGRGYPQRSNGVPPEINRPPIDPLTLYRVLGLVDARHPPATGRQQGSIFSLTRNFNRVSLNNTVENGANDRAADNSKEASNLFCKEVWQKLDPEARASVIYGNCHGSNAAGGLNGSADGGHASAFGFLGNAGMSRSNSRDGDSANGAACSCSSSQTGHLLQERLCLLTNPARYADTEPAALAGRMPPEVWIMVFRMLDDVSLWQCTRVSTAWRHLVLSNWGQNSWQRFTNSRWRFFRPIFTPVYWHAIYTSLMESSPCRPCQAQRLQPLDPASLVEQNSWRITRLENEKRSLAFDPPEGIEAIPLEPQLLHWQAAVRGPDKSPYMGGTFYLHILIPPRYPLGPPVVRFFTKIFHPNVSCHGDIGIDSIQHNWSLALTISKVLISIQSLLTDPYTKVCMEPYAGNLYENNRAKFEKIAREWTWRYAMADTLHPQPCQDELRLCEAATGPFEDNLLNDMSPLMGGDDEQENNDPDQDENDQENNDVDIENNDPEEANLIQEPQPNNPNNDAADPNLIQEPPPNNPINRPGAVNPIKKPQPNNPNNLEDSNLVHEPQRANPERPQRTNPEPEDNLIS